MFENFEMEVFVAHSGGKVSYTEAWIRNTDRNTEDKF
jgi:hypothetical protein